jgi:hypothetical protein
MAVSKTASPWNRAHQLFTKPVDFDLLKEERASYAGSFSAAPGSAWVRAGKG